MKKILLIISLVFVGIALYIYLSPKENTHTIISINGHHINIEYADTEEKRTQGLSGRESLPLEQGMFFIFTTPHIYSFWMKDMNFSIDILWINEKYEIVSITDNLRPETYPETVSPQEKVLYVLELNENAVEEYKIKIGDMISFVRK
jgi:hypothetical protein